MTTAMRAIRVVAGFGLLLGGVVLLVLPGPGWLTIIAGLALLSTEYAWARRLLDSLKHTAERWRQRIMRRRTNKDDDHRRAH